MDEIRRILEQIKNIDEKDIYAKEKSKLLWKQLFLHEKKLSSRERAGLILIVGDHFIKKRIYEYDLELKTYPADKFFSLIDSIYHEINQEFFERGYIDYIYMDSYYNLCKVVALRLWEMLRDMCIPAAIIHTGDLGFSLVPHFFVFVEDLSPYILDFTFRQFLLAPFFIPERTEHFRNAFVSPAFFGNMDFFSQLGSLGYFQATAENIKIYLDGFAKAHETYGTSDPMSLKRAKTPHFTSGNDYLNQLNSLFQQFDIERYGSYLKK